MTIPYSSIQDYLIDKLKPDFSPRNKDLTSAQLQTAAASSHPHKFQRSLPHPSPIPSISKIFLSIKPQPRQTLFHPLTAADCLAANRNLSCISFTASYFCIAQTYVLFRFILSHFPAAFQRKIENSPAHFWPTASPIFYHCRPRPQVVSLLQNSCRFLGPLHRVLR